MNAIGTTYAGGVRQSRNFKHCVTVYNQAILVKPRPVGAAPWHQGRRLPEGGKPPVAASLSALGKNMNLLEPWYNLTSRAHGTVIMRLCNLKVISRATLEM